MTASPQRIIGVDESGKGDFFGPLVSAAVLLTAADHKAAVELGIRDGKTIEQLDLNVLVGAAQVVELPETVKLITAEVIQKAGLGAGVERVLFKTSNSRIWSRGEKEFQTGFVAVSPDGAEEL
jgi:ribonuclease HII